MSVPDYNPNATAPELLDPRFRYGTRAIPEQFYEATSRYYLPTQRDSRFWPLGYDGEDNDCFDFVRSAKAVPCTSAADCLAPLASWCTAGQVKYVETTCQKSSGSEGTCVYSTDASF